LADCLATGAEAGARAASDCGFAVTRLPRRRAPKTRIGAITPMWWVKGSGKAFVDLQNDVTVKDVALAEQEGFRSVEHLKRYTTLGMATDQGKIGGVIGLAVMAELVKQPIPDVGTTTYRPPYTPVALGALAGHHRGKDFRPTRCRLRINGRSSNLRSWWRPARGCAPNIIRAGMMATGLKRLAAKYAPYARRSASVMYRHWAGSTCKVPMPAFSSIVYIPTCSRPCRFGKARYGLMLREDGFVMDDGTTSRLATTTIS
jgi:hypothetical protein